MASMSDLLQYKAPGYSGTLLNEFEAIDKARDPFGTRNPIAPQALRRAFLSPRVGGAGLPEGASSNATRRFGATAR